MLEGYRRGLESGDLQYATINLVSHTAHRLVAGDSLSAVSTEASTYLQVIRDNHQERFMRDMQRALQYCDNLMGHAVDPATLSGRWFNEAETRTIRELAGDKSAIAAECFHSGLLRYLFGRTTEAVDAFAVMEENLQGLAGTLYIAPFHMYSSLASLRALGTVGGAARRTLRKVRRHLRALTLLAKHAPANNAHRIALVEAELYRVTGDLVRATDAFDKAIALAEEHRWPHEAALAAELAGRFHFAAGRMSVAAGYLEYARRGYDAWSAAAKVSQLEGEFRSLLPSRDRAESAAGINALDMATVVKASQAISGEIVLDRLLERLMATLIENTGAERGILLLNEGGQLRVVAAAAAKGKATTVELANAPQERAFPMSVVNFVLRTRDNVVLSDAAEEGEFTRDPYIAQAKPRSVLCAAIARHEQVTGVIYVENNLLRGAFTPDRLRIVGILASQAAISIQNAHLTAKLQEEAVTRSNLLRFFPPQAVSRILGGGEASLETVNTEVAAVFCDISGFTRMCDEMAPADIVVLLNAYFPMMAEIVFRHEGMLEKYIGDALLAVWGAPFRHAEDTDRAVECAIEMQRELLAFNRRSRGMRELAIHIGIDVGAVAAGNIGSPQYIQYATIGNTTNMASRICEAAQPGEILISEGAYSRLRRSAHRAELRPPANVKGRAAPLRLYRVAWADRGAYPRLASGGVGDG
jgi:class 3 adenylate cyclase